jgi:hypothetical protein
MLEDNHFVTALENLNILCGQIKAQLVVHSPMANGNVTYVADVGGTGGNSIRVRHINPGPSQPLTVSVSGQDITVSLETDGLGNVISTAAAVAAAVMADPAANALVDVVAEGTGGGIAGVLPSFTNLAGGGPNVPVQNIIKFDAADPPTSWGTLPREINAVLSAACKANLVEVQILAADATGRYIAPTQGLAMALKAKLDSMKESTVQTIVFDGSRNLFPVDALVKIKVLDGFNTVVVANNVKRAVEGLLLSRKYAESVRISDAYALVEAVEGVQFSHIFFSVPKSPGKVNPTTGDVDIKDDEVVTLGTVTTTLI